MPHICSLTDIVIYIWMLPSKVNNTEVTKHSAHFLILCVLQYRDVGTHTHTQSISNASTTTVMTIDITTASSLVFQCLAFKVLRLHPDVMPVTSEEPDRQLKYAAQECWNSELIIKRMKNTTYLVKMSISFFLFLLGSESSSNSSISLPRNTS